MVFLLGWGADCFRACASPRPPPPPPHRCHNAGVVGALRVGVIYPRLYDCVRPTCGDKRSCGFAVGVVVSGAYTIRHRRRGRAYLRRAKRDLPFFAAVFAE